jgi:hypothetical protein
LAVSVPALQVAGFDMIGWLGALTEPFWSAISGLLSAMAYVLLAPFLWLLGLAHPHGLRLRRPLSPFNNGQYHAQPKPLPVNGHLVFAVEVLLILAAIAAIAVLIWYTSIRIQRRERREAPERSSSSWSPGAVWQSVRSWLHQLLRRSSEATNRAIRATRRRVLGPVYPEDPVRRLYAQLLVRAAAHGAPRPTSITPQEYERQLAERWPDGSADFAALTRAYVRRRYGDLPIDDEMFLDLRTRWHRLRSLIREPPHASIQ